MAIIIIRCYINRWLFLLLLASQLEDSESQNCEKDLLNQVVNDGDSAIFESAIDSWAYWRVLPASDFMSNADDITNTTGSLNPQYEGIYSVDSTNLTVIAASGFPLTIDSDCTAGVYLLTYEDTGCMTAANLITISNGGPSCDCDPINQLVNCTISYAESTLQPNSPSITWADSDGNSYYPDIKTPNRNAFDYTAVSKVSISSDGASEYTCQVTFSAPSPFPFDFMATNAPSYTASCSIANCLITTTTSETITTSTAIQTTTSAVPTSTTINAQNIQIQPTYGPVAGGTIVSITSKWLDNNVFISAVYVGENLRAANYSRSYNTVLVKTPKIDNEQLINQHLPIVLEISPGPHNISTGQFFTYKPNPGVEDVNPKVLVISGGIHLNITGYSLTSVAQPLLRAATIILSINGTTKYNNETFGPCDPPTENGTQMICVSPPIYIRDDFLHQLFNATNPYSNSSFNRRRRDVTYGYLWRKRFDLFQQMGTLLNTRSKRSDSASISTNETYVSKNGQELMRIFLGIVFDGYERYKDDIVLDSTGNFEVTYPPSVLCKGDNQFDPGQSNNSTITIEGSRMEKCCQMIDYTVRIGDGFCSLTSLTDNALTCSPPKVKPQQTEQDKLYCGKNFAIFVDLGAITSKCSCLSYSDDNTTTVIIIVVTTVGSVLLIVISIIIILIIIRKIRKSKNKSQRASVDDGKTNKTVDARLPIDIRSLESTEYGSTVSYRNQIFTTYAPSSTDEFNGRHPMPDPHARPVDQSFYSTTIYSNSSDENYRSANEIDYTRFIDDGGLDREQ